MTADRAGDRHLAWLLHHELLEAEEISGYQDFDLPFLISAAYPEASAEHHALLIDVLGWYTVVDDHFDGPAGRSAAAAKRTVSDLCSILRAPNAAPHPGNGMVGAWQDLWLRQRAVTTDLWQKRAAVEWEDCLGTFVTEAEHREAGRLPHLAEAVRLRRHASCLYPFMNMLEPVHGIELPEYIVNDPLLQRVRALTADASALLNDLCSLEREERQGLAFNLVAVLREEHGISRREAVTRAREDLDEIEASCDELRHEFAGVHPGFSWYSDGTRRLVEGVRGWLGVTGRY
ncbi:terpene synthase family protein [Lentzea sp.]|uniref:terpene synthase family protein n=1 Tax=Lentzea sp. TaxID=56099 RepID=UPI002ED1FABC